MRGDATNLYNLPRMLSARSHVFQQHLSGNPWEIQYAVEPAEVVEAATDQKEVEGCRPSCCVVARTRQVNDVQDFVACVC